MPLFSYKCVDCGQVDERIGGVDDHVAICVNCNGLMIRQEDWPEILERTFESELPKA
jgi:predicted nucleic acid-binding Zn ribbon protein